MKICGKHDYIHIFTDQTFEHAANRVAGWMGGWMDILMDEWMERKRFTKGNLTLEIKQNKNKYVLKK